MLDLILFVMPYIQAAALVFARPLGFIIVFPMFEWIGLRGMIRNVIAVAIGLPYVQTVYVGIAGDGIPLDAEFILLLAGKEFLIGAVLGLVLGIPFWAADMAGAQIDVFRGTSAATVASPTQMSEPMITGALFSITLVAIFLSMGGLRTVIGIIYESYEIWPFFEPFPSVTPNLSPVLISILTQVAYVGLALGAPILIAMFLGELALAFTSRFAPQINIFDATLSLKNIIYLLILPPYMMLLTRHYGVDLLDVGAAGEIIRGLAGDER